MSASRVEDQSSTHSNSAGSEHQSFVSQPTGEFAATPGYAARLESFSNYPPPHLVNILHLAKNGFIYSPTPENQRGVLCVACKSIVSSWKQGDEPFRPEFHAQGCRFATSRPPSQSSGSITDISENFLRASVHSNEESTKPLETAGTSGMPVESTEMLQLPERGMMSRLSSISPSQVPARQAQSMPVWNTPGSIPPPSMPPTIPQGRYSYTRMRARDEGGHSTREVEHIQAQHPHQHSGNYPLSQPPSFQSVYPASSLHGSASGTFSNVTYPPRDEHRSTHSSFERQRHASLSPYQSPRHQALSPRDQEQDILNTLEMRIARNRLLTFEHFWPEDTEFRNYRLLVVCGFFCIGQGDAVECFCCHVVIANWSRNDNPRTRHIEMSSVCRFMRDEECGNVPLPVERRRTIQAPSHSLFPPSSTQSRRSSRHSSPYSSRHSSPQHSFVAQPSVEEAVGPPPSHPSMEVAASPPSVSHPSFHSSLGAVAERYSNPTTEMYQRSNLMMEFPCLNPANASMREERDRLQTFWNGEFRRHTRLRASNETLAKAGLYFVGNGDSVKCWFCDGGLRDFQPEDDPWMEHAKYFPECEYLLQQRGPDWISRVSVQNPNVQRPILPRREARILPQVVSSPTPLPPPPPRITDPDQLEQHRRHLLERGMESEPVRRAREMGYSDERIRQVQWQKILLDDCTYQSAETLVAALTPDTNFADSPPIVTSQSPVPAPATVTVRPSSFTTYNYHTSGGEAASGTYVNGQFYPTSTNSSNPHSSVHHTTTNQSNATGLFVNGQSMQDIMANAFDHPFFRGEMDHLFAPRGSSTVVRSTTPHATVHHHFHSNPTITHHFRPRAPTATASRAPAVAPPPRPPLQPINIPRRNTPASSSSAGSSTSSASTTTPSSNIASNVSTRGEMSANERLAELERERVCKICLNAQAVILFRPCGHICSCNDCARRVTVCPVCRTGIEQYIRTYHA